MKAWARARARGPGEVAAAIATRIRENIASDEELLFLARATSSEEPGVAGISFFIAQPDDGERYARDIGTDSAVTFRARLDDHTRCFLAADGERLLHASWVTTCAAWTRELRRFIQPPTGDAYVYESFTSPAARGRGLYPAALRSLVPWLAARGVDRLWVAVEADNPPSLRAVAKAGFTEQFVVRYQRRAGRLRIDTPVEQLDGGWRFSGSAPRPGDCAGPGLG